MPRPGEETESDTLHIAFEFDGGGMQGGYDAWLVFDSQRVALGKYFSKVLSWDFM
jgi:hypothetical protein